MPRLVRRFFAATATVVALWPLLIGCLLVVYFGATMFSGQVDSPAVVRARGCCPAPLTPDAAVASTAAAAAVLAIVAALPVLMWFGGRFAITGRGVAPRLVVTRMTRVAVPAALIGAAVAIAEMT